MADATPLEQAAEALARIQASVAADPLRFAAYLDRPLGFIHDCLGVGARGDYGLWSRQQDIINAAWAKRRVAVYSGQGIGKSFALACLVITWLYVRRGLVVTTANTWQQVEDVLWREINDLVSHALVPLPRQHKELMNSELRVDNSWYAIGLSTNEPEAFVGRHHPWLLAIIDEAQGVPEPIHQAVARLTTGAHNHVVMIGNPMLTSGTFYNARKRPDLWHCLKISCFEHPNVVAGQELIPGAVTREWIDERKADFGLNYERHPLWAPTVLGEPPKISLRGVIPLGWVERSQQPERQAQALEAAQQAKLPRIGGLDVARYGENACVLTVRQGDAIEDIESWHHLSLMETTGKAMRAIKDRRLSALVVDASGIGAGVVDRLLEQGAPVYAYNGGHRAFTQATFSNRRTEMWWHLRERFEKERLWLPDHPLTSKLVSELVMPEYELASSGRIKMQTKEDLLKDGKPSPDFADSLVLCFAMDLDPAAEPKPTPQPGQDPTIYQELIPLGGDTWDPQLPAGF